MYFIWVLWTEDFVRLTPGFCGPQHSIHFSKELFSFYRDNILMTGNIQFSNLTYNLLISLFHLQPSFYKCTSIFLALPVDITTNVSSSSRIPSHYSNPLLILNAVLSDLFLERVLKIKFKDEDESLLGCRAKFSLLRDYAALYTRRLSSSYSLP
jgi:hypothetical protein